VADEVGGMRDVPRYRRPGGERSDWVA